MSTYKTIIIAEGQNIVDVLLQEYGSFAELPVLQEDNPNLVGPNALLQPGQELKIRVGYDTGSDRNQDQARYFAARFVNVNTGEELVAGDFNNDFNNDFSNAFTQ